MPQMMITNGREGALSLPDRGRDLLKAGALNALPGPLLARMFGGGEHEVYEIIDIEVECAIFRANVGGLSQVMEFCCIKDLIDINGERYDPDDFWLN